MSAVTHLYRYPVKGFTPEPRDTIVIQQDGRVEGDRVLAFRFSDAVQPELRDGLDYWPKSRGLALMGFPSLGRLRLSFDGRGLTINDQDRPIVCAGLDPAGRALIEERVTEWMLTGPDAQRFAKAGPLPLRLVGDGLTSRFQDRPRGFVSLHSEASVEALQRSQGTALDDRRFRSNIVVTGLDPFEELGWVGQDVRLRIGDVSFEVLGPIVRCGAITANPDTGLRDLNLLKTLKRECHQEEATLGVLLLPSAGGGHIATGDEFTLSRPSVTS